VSLLNNNLARSSNGWLASIHNSVVQGGGKLLLSGPVQGACEGPGLRQATSVRYVDLAGLGCPALVVCSTAGTQVYEEDGQTQLFYAPVPDQGAENPAALSYHQGCCVVPALAHMVIGTSKGSLLPVITPAARGGDWHQLPENSPSSPATGVADVCFSETAGAVFSAHASGELRVWTCAPGGPGSGSYSNVKVAAAVGEAPTRIASLGPRIAVAYGPGTVVLHSVADLSLEPQVEVTAHARWTTAVEVVEELGWIVTVGEDTVLNVWKVDAVTGQVDLQHTSVVAAKLLTGVAIDLGPARSVLVSAYDAGEVFKVPLAC